MVESPFNEPADGRICSAAAERNTRPILEVLRRELPERGVVLEVASGGGQHAVAFAEALPDLAWQPSDPSPQACGSIHARRAESGLENLRPPLALDVRDRPWPLARADAVVCVNLLHISPWSATTALFAAAARILPPGGPLLVYGPFMLNGEHTAASNAAFDADLQRRDPSWGVRDRDDVAAEAAACGMTLTDTVSMPANNLTLVFRKQR